MIKKYSKEKLQEVITARKQGATLKEISSRTGVSVTTIKKWLSDSAQLGVSGIRIRRDFRKGYRHRAAQADDALDVG